MSDIHAALAAFVLRRDIQNRRRHEHLNPHVHMKSVDQSIVEIREIVSSILQAFDEVSDKKCGFEAGFHNPESGKPNRYQNGVTIDGINFHLKSQDPSYALMVHKCLQDRGDAGHREYVLLVSHRADRLMGGVDSDEASFVYTINDQNQYAWMLGERFLSNQEVAEEIVKTLIRFAGKCLDKR